MASMMRAIFIIFCFPIAYSQMVMEPLLPLKKLQLPSGTVGPEAIAFDILGNGPYTSVADGRVLKYQGPRIGFTDFATTSPLRTKEVCDGKNDPNLLIKCGRPLGLGFYYRSGDLYIADINYGLLVVGRNGGPARQLATGIDGNPFAFTNAVDIDQLYGVVYFTDSGPIFRATSNITLLLESKDTTGRLFKYDIRTNRVTLLLSGLAGPAGVAVSLDGSYVLVTELIANRIKRFWVRGTKANTAEVFTNLNGYPDNIKRTILGDYFVAVNIVNNQSMTPPKFSFAQRINVLGNVIVSLNLSAQYRDSISEVQEQFGRLYIGSLKEDFVGVYGV
ncbi:protein STRICTOSIDINE SYNTHASE-LIKE 11-like [Solanum verrucosum]|nr:protein STRICTOSIDINE SYNTHASE-LIKE 11-like [Solanum verrucosum]